jgi:hypothetical protein
VSQDISSQADVAEAPLSNPVSETLSATEGAALSGVVVGQFTDGNPLASPAEFSATISWGDGQTSAASFSLVSTTATTSVWDVTGTHTYAEDGTDAISLTVADGTASQAIASQANVAEAALSNHVSQTLTTTEGTVLTNAVVGQFTDGNPLASASDFSATINWGDGQTSAASFALVSTTATSSVWNVTGSHVYEEGTYTISMTVADGTVSQAISSEADVADATITITPPSPSTVAATHNVVTFFNLGSFTDPGAPVESEGTSAYLVQVDWGDGSNIQTLSASALLQAGNTFTINHIAHKYTTPGTYTITLDVFDTAGGFDTGFTMVLTVNVS